MSSAISVCRDATACFVLALVFVLPSRADAHRLDEYLQATRVSVAADQVRLEIDLSPGVDVADGIIRAIDTNGDGRIAEGEADAYAWGVLREMSVSVDGRPVDLSLESRVFPEVDAMRQGVGTIRLTAAASMAPVSGPHQLAFANAYLPSISANLVNAFVPTDRRVALRAQVRDSLQRTYTLDYDVAGSHAWLGWSGTALAMLAVLVIGRTRSTRMSARRHPVAPLPLR